ncbi:carbohydrate ABC transporter permease [Alphaproteobacteria bacterium]|nr:carbohydrate ABC transporter permease [Alphaproteobacteria bacterium]
MFWKYGLFCSIFAGSIWGTFWQIIFTMMGILTFGIPLELDVNQMLIIGLVSGIFYINYQKIISMKIHLTTIFTMTLLVYVFNFGKPYQINESLNNINIFTLIFLTSAVTWISINFSLNKISIGKLSRYDLENFYIKLMWALGLIIFILITLVPFYIMIMTSLKNQQSLILNPLDFSININSDFKTLFNSYIELFTDFNFHLFLINSFFVSCVTVFITLFFSIPGAYALSRLRFPSKKLFSSSVILIYLIPSIVLVIPLYAIFSQIGLRNSLLALIIIYPATTIPVALYMLRGYFSSLSSEIDDAALMDGLSRVQIIFKIAIPLSKPAIVSVGLYVFMIAWNEFLIAFMFLDDPSIFTLSRGIMSLNSSEVPQQHLMAGAVIATIPVMIIFLYLEKFLISGLSTGGVKE